MSRVLYTGDWQIEAGMANDKLDSMGRSIRLQETVQVIKDMLSLGWEKGARTLVHGGDVTEHKNIKSVESKAVAECFRHWLDHGGDIVALAGNHDGSLYDVSSSSFEGLAIMAGKSFRLVHAPTYFEDLNLVALPYLHNKTLAEIGAAHLAIREKVKGAMPWLAAHYGSAGCRVGAANLTVPGDMLGTDQLFPNGLGYSVVMLSHIHRQQVITMMNGSDAIDVVHVGSPAINDFGERHDVKGFALLETTTGRYELEQIDAPRQFVQIEIGDGTTPAEAAWATPTWCPGDLLKIHGVYAGNIHPRAQFLASVRNKLVPEPFCTPIFDVKPLQEARVTRGAEYVKISSLREAAAAYTKDKYKDKSPELVAQILALVTDAIQESSATVFAPRTRPLYIKGHNVMTFKDLDYTFPQEEPTLVTGLNGIGKSNLVDLVNIAINGVSFKNLPVGGTLRRGTSEGWLKFALVADDGSVFLITRTFKRSARGVTHKVTVQVETPQTGGFVDWTDGGVKDIQSAIEKGLCAPADLVQTVNFFRQLSDPLHDSKPFVRQEPSVRKRILSEIQGHAPLGAGFKRLTDIRLVASRALDAAKDKLEGMLTLFNPEERQGLVDATRDYAAIETKLAVSSQTAGAALEHAKGVDDAQEQALNEASTALRALPDTASALAAAKAAIVAEDASYARNYPVLKARYATLKAEVADLGDKSAKLSIIDLENGVVSVQEKVSQLDTELQKALSAADAEFKAATLRVETAAAVAIAPLEAKLQTLTEDWARVKLEEAGSKIQLGALDKQLSDLAGGLIENCPACGQKVDSSHTKTEIERLTKERLELGQLHLAQETDVSLVKKSLEAATAQKTAHLADVQAQKAKVQSTADLQKSTVNTRAQGQKSVLAAELKTAQSALDAGRLIMANWESKKIAFDTCVAEGVKLNADHTAAANKLIARQAAAQVAEDLNASERVRLQQIELAQREQTFAARGALDRAREAWQKADQEYRDASFKSQAAQDRLAKHDETKVKLDEANNIATSLGEKHDITIWACDVLDPKTGLPIYLVDSCLDALEIGMNNYMGILGRPDIHLKLSTQDGDKETLLILVDDGRVDEEGNPDLLDIRAYSGGQGTRMELSIKLALADLVKDTRESYLGMFFLDEPETGLEEAGKQALVDLLHDRSRSGWPVIMVVTHDETFLGSFSRRLTAEAGPDGDTLLVTR